MKYLLEKKARLDPNPPERSFSALHQAVGGRWRAREEMWDEYYEMWEKYPGIRDQLRKPDAGPSPVIGNTEVIRLLVEAGADLNGVNCEGDQPLHIAARKFELETVQFLLKTYPDRIDINALDKFGRSPLDRAISQRCLWGNDCSKRKAETIRILREAGAKELFSNQPVIPGRP